MNRSSIIYIIFIILFLSLLASVYAGLMVAEGSIEVKAMEKKKVCGMACIFSVYENPSTYRFVISDNLGKFVDKVEPDTFTLTGIQCPNEPSTRRECIGKLCNDPNSTSTKMPCIYFNGPLEFSFDICNGLPCGSKIQKYEGSIRAIGSIGAAQTIEPLSFFVYYTPISGWPVLILVISLIVVITLFIYKKVRRVRSGVLN